ncbi:MAG: DUF4349 domain-containing protein [Gemmatimonadaceae bacterium]
MRRPLIILMVATMTLLACSGGGVEDESSAAGGDGKAIPPQGQPAPSGEANMEAPEATDRDMAGQPPRGFATSQGTSASPAPSPDASAAATQGGDIAPAMIIRTGSVSVEVDSLEPAVAQVQALAIRLGGWVANTSMQTGQEQLRSATLELKIPAARFNDAVTGLRPIGELESVDVVAQDVGEEYVDITARVENARRLEERLINLLARRTGDLEDVLAVERELARVRGEIERYEGRMRYLRSRASVSTLSVTVHEPPPIVGPYASSNPIAEAFRQAWRNFVGFVAAIIASLGILIPLGAIVIIAFLLWRRMPRRPRRPGGDSEG